MKVVAEKPQAIVVGLIFQGATGGISSISQCFSWEKFVEFLPNCHFWFSNCLLVNFSDVQFKPRSRRPWEESHVFLFRCGLTLIADLDGASLTLGWTQSCRRKSCWCLTINFCGSVDWFYCIWLVLSDEQMSKRWPFSLLNDEQMSNRVGVKHLPGIYNFLVGNWWSFC